MAVNNPLNLSKKIFLNHFGLDHDNMGETWPELITLAEGRVDNRTSAAEAVTSRTEYSPMESNLSIILDYWNMRPDGRQTKHNLIDFEFSVKAAEDIVTPTSIWVMGRKLYQAPDDADNIILTPGLIKNLNHARSAAKYLNQSLRRGELPNIVDIFKQTGLNESVGDRLHIIGQDRQNQFNYPYDLHSEHGDTSPLLFPIQVAKALLAEDTNSIDSHQRIGSQRDVTEVDPQHGTEFLFSVSAKEQLGNELESHLHIQPVSIPDDIKAFAVPEFQSTRLKLSQGKDQALLEEFKFLGLDLLQADHTTRMKILGVSNRIKHDLRNREYPKVMDYLAEYDLLELADNLITRDRLSPPPHSGRMVIEAKLGHNTGDEVAAGYGHKPDGNCTLVEMQWLDQQGNFKRLGVGHDLGLSLPPEDVANKGAVADVVKNLSYIDYWFLTHDHLDHKSGFVPYIAKGYFRNKIICGTAEQIRSLREDLNVYDYPEEYNPIFKEIKGHGAVHIKDEQGITRLSVVYSTEGTPHTARCTPYMYVGRNGSQVIDTYLNPGDMRFGKHNADDYVGHRPDVDYLDKYFFEHWGEILANDDPTIDPQVRTFPIVRCDFDGTSIRKAGYAPTDWECENNRNTIFSILNDIIPNKHIGISQISSNEMGFESWLRVATQQGRDITTAGANIEKKARTLNVKGVNKLRLEAQKRRNIQLYLDNYFFQNSSSRLAQLEHEFNDKSRLRSLEDIKRDIKMEKLVQESFRALRRVKQSDRRILKRDELEENFKNEFGEHRHLGSIYTSITSNVSRRLSKNPERWLTLETGTQGSFVEIDSTFYKRSEGRSRFDLRADKKHTARPLAPQKTVLCIAQNAIPGNEKKQKTMADRLIERGYTVMISVHDGFEIHGLSAHQNAQLNRALTEKGHTVSTYDDGGLFVSNMPIHAPGHGFAKDVEGWLKLINPVFPLMQHTGDAMAVQRFREITQDTLGRPGNYFENFERVTTERNPNSEQWDIVSLGRSIPSIILIEIIRKVRQYYGGHIEATRVIRFDGRGGLSQDGLRTSIKENGTYNQHFATVSTDLARRKITNDTSKRPVPIDYNKSPPVPERIYRGPIRPDDDLYDVSPGLRECAA